MGEQYLASGNFYISSNIPPVFSDTGDGYAWNEVIARIYIGERLLYMVTLTVRPDDKTVTFGVREFIELYMRNSNLTYSDFSITLSDPDGAEFRTYDISVLFHAGFCVLTAQDLALGYFLSDIDSMIVPEWYRGEFSLYNPLTENQNIEIWITPKGKQPVLADDELFATPGFNTYTIDLREIKQRGIDNRVLLDTDITAHVRVVAGQRTLDLYVKKQTPSACIVYRNRFNRLQTVYFFGSWKQKNTTEAKTALVDGNLIAYDTVAGSEIEILSHPMEPESLFMLSQIGRSQTSRFILFAGRSAYVFSGVITDSSSEAAPHQEDLEQLKITAISKDQSGVLHINNADYRIFNDIFNNSFI